MKEHKAFVCSECGYDAPKWYGQCPACKEWNTMSEIKIQPESTKKISTTVLSQGDIMQRKKPIPLDDVQTGFEKRMSTGISEFDRVLGGGAVCGSLVLISGEPGIGKSTLLIQACANIAQNSKILYVSGEESLGQIKLRAKRLGAVSPELYVLAETDLNSILQSSDNLRPSLIVVDSIQTIYKSDVESTPGSISQIRECTFALMQYAKITGTTIFVVGHVNKDGGIAGPKILEHMVDCVLYFEGDMHISYRLLRAEKNRFGSTNEIGVFDMTSCGLHEVLNPSEALLSGRPEHSPGSCVACTMEGSRPILAEIQALVAKTSFGVPRRMSAGVDYNRMALLMAILEKRAGLMMANFDAYVNVIGGLRIDEPAIDLPAALAIASSFKDHPIAEKLTAFGELGLTGELRAVTAVEQRLNEIKRLGFARCIVPAGSTSDIKIPDGLEVIPVKTVMQAITVSLM